ncbi:MAG: hypothetical protein KBT02_02965 [Treponema sp.]|nr:hypothetical protein [Candidatus Treponema caballi]
MTLPPKLEKLLENWPVKIVSLVAAILVYAFYQISTLETRYFIVPLEITKSAGMVSTNVSETAVRVSIRGEQTQITSLETKDFTAYADLSRIVNEGTENIPIQLKLSDSVRIMKDVEIRIEPETVSVTLEKELIDYLPVKINYSGGTAHGYEIESMKAVPPLIKVTGPESLVENIKSLDTDVILVEDISQTMDYETMLLEQNSELRIDYSDPIHITISVIPSQMTRNLSNVAIESYPAAENLMTEFDTDTAACTIMGNQLDVESFSPRKGFLYIDCSEISEPGEYDVPVQSRKYNWMNVDSIVPETIHVIVTENTEIITEIIEE